MTPSNWPLTFQSSVVDALLEFGFLYDNGAAAGEDQLAGSSFVAFPVVLGDWHCVLGTDVRTLMMKKSHRRFISCCLFENISLQTFIFSVPRACSTLGLRSSPSEPEETCCYTQFHGASYKVCEVSQKHLNLTESCADKQLGHTLCVVVLLVLEDLAGDPLLVQLFTQSWCQWCNWRKQQTDHTERDWWLGNSYLVFPLRTDLLAVAPHHVLHAQLTQMLWCLKTKTDRV